MYSHVYLLTAAWDIIKRYVVRQAPSTYNLILFDISN